MPATMPSSQFGLGWKVLETAFRSPYTCSEGALAHRSRHFTFSPQGSPADYSATRIREPKKKMLPIREIRDKNLALRLDWPIVVEVLEQDSWFLASCDELNVHGAGELEVCKAFDVRPEWLLLGRGPMREGEESATSAKGSAARGGRRDVCALGGEEPPVDADGLPFPKKRLKSNTRPF